jgi:hypothetical protein
MVTRDTPWPPGTPCWVDLAADDVGSAIAFYGALFGWDIQSAGPQAGGYHIAYQYGRAVAGLGSTAEGQPSTWTTYLATDDADATAAAITAAGGRLLAGPADLLGQGRMALATDTAGAVFGLWEAGSMEVGQMEASSIKSSEIKGIGLANEPGSLCWNEHTSDDLPGSLAFYRAVFGYESEEMTANYTLLKTAGQQSHVGGIGSAVGPAGWSTYFAVADTATALALAQGLGATIVRPRWDSDWGPMVTVADDQGAVFSLCTAPADS